VIADRDGTLISVHRRTRHTHFRSPTAGRGANRKLRDCSCDQSWQEKKRNTLLCTSEAAALLEPVVPPNSPRNLSLSQAMLQKYIVTILLVVVVSVSADHNDYNEEGIGGEPHSKPEQPSTLPHNLIGRPQIKTNATSDHHHSDHPQGLHRPHVIYNFFRKPKAQLAQDSIAELLQHRGAAGAPPMFNKDKHNSALLSWM
jgi:hypothetical protein